MRFGDNPNVSGTLLISDGVVAGADIPGNGNPYARFASLRHAAVIDRGVYVYYGLFNLGPAAALEHIHAAQDFSAKHDASGLCAKLLSQRGLTRTIQRRTRFWVTRSRQQVIRQQRGLSTLRHSTRQSSILSSKRDCWLSCKRRRNDRPACPYLSPVF